MTTPEFRKMALEIPAAVERSHMNHPDFRVAGKIFASLGVPDQNWGMVKLTPEQQRAFIRKAPEVFKPCSGAWGRQATRIFILPPRTRAWCAPLSTLRQRMSRKRRRKRGSSLFSRVTASLARTFGVAPKQTCLEFTSFQGCGRNEKFVIAS